MPKPLSRLLVDIRTYRPRFFDDYPVVEPDVRASIPAAIEDIEKSLVPATATEIGSALAMLDFALPMGRNMPAVSAEARAKIYVKALSDIPVDVLNDACMEAVKTLKFFPKVAELRELAAPELARRNWNLATLRILANVHDERYRPPIAEKDKVKPEDLAKLAKRLGGRFPSKRKAA